MRILILPFASSLCSELSPSVCLLGFLSGYNLSSSASLHSVNPAQLAEAQQEFESREADLELAAEENVFVFSSPFCPKPPYCCLMTLEIEIDPGVLTITPDIALFLFSVKLLEK